MKYYLRSLPEGRLRRDFFQTKRSYVKITISKFHHFIYQVTWLSLTRKPFRCIRKTTFKTYFSIFLLKVAAAVVVGWVIEDKLKVCAGTGKRYLRVSLAATAHEPHLAFFGRPVSVSSVSNLPTNISPHKYTVYLTYQSILKIYLHKHHLVRSALKNKYSEYGQ